MDELIVDAQVHVWAPATVERPWAPGAETYADGVENLSSADREPLGPDELLGEMDAVGVDRAILVPPTFTGDDNSVALQGARHHPDRFAVMGRIDLTEPQPDSVASWLETPGMLGVRLTFHWGAQRYWLHDGTADWFWPCAEEHDIPVMVFCPGDLERIAEVARTHPRLRLIIDHFALPLGVRGDGIGAVVDELLRLADLDNVAVKASALPSYVDEPAPFPSLHPHIERVVGAFGASRVFWGSELTRLPCSYAEVLALFAEDLESLSGEQRRSILGAGVTEWLGWPRPPTDDTNPVN